jgi:6-phosphofructokinase 1
MKTLAIVSGGDAPGINMALAHYARIAAIGGDEITGALGGFAGLVAGSVVNLEPAEMNRWALQSGAFLPSSREPILRAPDAEEILKGALQEQGIDNILIFGGDGSLHHIPPLLRSWGIACVGLPTTIDNDVGGTEETLGFDSACNYAYQALTGAVATAHALPGRIFMIETLGGSTGFLALAIALGAGAHAVLIPEYPYAKSWLRERLVEAVARDGYGLLVLSEGVAAARSLADDIPRWTKIRVRDTRLGHAQRGAFPSHRDRVLAVSMAEQAYRALRGGATQGTVVVRGGSVSFDPATCEHFDPPQPDRAVYNAINGLGNAAAE